MPGLKKKPSTSELLDWLKLLMAEDIPPETLHSQDQHKIIPPLHGALLKNEQDVHLFERLVFMSRRRVSAKYAQRKGTQGQAKQDSRENSDSFGSYARWGRGGSPQCRTGFNRVLFSSSPYASFAMKEVDHAD